MKLLDIELPPFARITWNSPEAREYWKPRLERINTLYVRVERETVRRGLRACTTWNLWPKTMYQDLQELADLGLTFIPIKTVARYQGFAHRHVPANPGDENAMIYGVVCKDYEAGMAFKMAHLGQETRHVDIGELLGYPKCCREFFQKVWVEQRIVDPIYQQAMNTQGVQEVRDEADHHRQYEVHTVMVEGNPLCNVALRYFGLRICPLLPHSYDCPETIKFVQQWLDIAFELDPEAATDLMTLLEMPYEWSAFKGYGVVHTPIFRGHFNTVPCWPEYRVRYVAKDPKYFDWLTFKYPSKGNRFPYSEFQLHRQLERLESFVHVKTEEDSENNIRLAHSNRKCGCGGSCNCS